MRRCWLAIIFILLFSLNSYAAKEAAVSSKNNISIVFDNGVGSNASARQAKAQNQIGNYMGPDLVRVFARYAKKGFTAKLIKSKGEYKKSENEHLLLVKITDYNPGNVAARAFVGMGAGGVKLDIHYELFVNGKSVISKDDGVFSSRGWMMTARKLNENMAKEVTQAIQ